MNYLQLSVRYWILSGLVCVSLLLGLEALFRKEVLWKQPLGLALTLPTDINSRAVWWSYKPPGTADRRVLLVGSSTALASMQLPDDGTSKMFTDASRDVTVEFRSLCIGGATFADYLTLMENAIAHGYEPDLVIAYSGPLMFTPEAVTKASIPTRFIPLVSRTWLDALEQQNGGGIPQRLYHSALTHSAVLRHRFYVNTWVHRRWAYVLRREFKPVLDFDEERYRHARRGALEEDEERFDLVSSITDRFRTEAAAGNGMQAFLTYLREHKIPAVVLEAPRSPPARKLYEPITPAYAGVVGQSVRDYGVRYIDPNEGLYLESDDFADMYHVSWKGRRRWLEAVVPVLATLIG